MENALPNQVYLIDEPTGQGHVILFADDPNFRAVWDGLTRLFLNSIFFAPILTTVGMEEDGRLEGKKKTWQIFIIP